MHIDADIYNAAWFVAMSHQFSCILKVLYFMEQCGSFALPLYSSCLMPKCPMSVIFRPSLLVCICVTYLDSWK